jgi:hypothetical protein
MRRFQFVVLSLPLLSGLLAQQPNATPPKSLDPGGVTPVEREIREFLDSYAADLRANRREAIADRYDSRGAFFLGMGEKHFEAFDAIRNRYLTSWGPPKSFAWKDISIEVLSNDAALVLCRFDWQHDSGATLTLSYSGLFVRRSGKWRIRVEDESLQPPPMK